MSKGRRGRRGGKRRRPRKHAKPTASVRTLDETCRVCDAPPGVPCVDTRYREGERPPLMCGGTHLVLRLGNPGE